MLVGVTDHQLGFYPSLLTLATLSGGTSPMIGDLSYSKQTKAHHVSSHPKLSSSPRFKLVIQF